MRIRLTQRLAEAIDGISLSGRAVGDLIEMSQHDAETLVAEGWASAVSVERPHQDCRPAATKDPNGSSIRPKGKQRA
jgi:hypothetical protein